jgi:hypothetical protein
MTITWVLVSWCVGSFLIAPLVGRGLRASIEGDLAGERRLQPA